MLRLRVQLTMVLHNQGITQIKNSHVNLSFIESTREKKINQANEKSKTTREKKKYAKLFERKYKQLQEIV